MTFRRLLSYLSPVDFVSIAFLLFLTSLNLIFAARVDAWKELVIINTVVVGLIGALAWRAETRRTKLWMGLHRWYCYPFIIFVFKELYLMVRPIHPIDYDALFIEIDRWMFGVDPTVWMGQFAHPVVTEILQIAYFSYYLLFIILGVGIYRRYAVEEFDKAAFLIVYGFYLSYLGYFLLPAVGPRFTLHDFHMLDAELPGLLVTQFLRDFINAAESIPKNHPNPIDVVQRDVFPSGHTQLTLIVVVLAYRYKLATRGLMTVLAILLIIGTVYLRYHYVIDLIAGAAVAWITLWTGDRLEAWWSRWTGELRRHELETQSKSP
jgi:membrane-associated phospholipid phosphatase